MPVVMPHDLHLEKRLVALMMNPWPSTDTAKSLIAAGLTSEDFFRLDYRPVVDACIALHAAGISPNTMLVAGRLTAKVAQVMRGVAGLEHLTDGVPLSAPDQLAAMVRDLKALAWRRETIESIERYRSRLYDRDESVDELSADLTRWREFGRAPDLPLLNGIAILEAHDVPWLVTGMIQRNSIAMVAAAANAGKSHLTLSLVAAVKRSTHDPMRWLDTFEIPTAAAGDVVMVLTEGHNGMKARLQTTVEACGLTRDDLEGMHFHVDGLSLVDHKSVDRFIRRLPNRSIAMVVIDCWAQAILPGNENDQRDTGTAIAAVKRIMRATNATVIIVHHVGKNGSQERGSSVLRDACDTVIRIEGCRKQTRKVTCDKQREAVPFAPWHFRLAARGSSCIPVIVDTQADDKHDDGDQRDDRGDSGGVPAVLMERARQIRRKSPKLSVTAVADRLGGRRQTALAAARRTANEGD